MFTYNYEPRYGDFKNFDVIKPATVLDVVQDISIKDSNRAGFGLNVLKEMNLAWLMQGINIRFIKPVKVGEVISASTAVKTLKGATSERGCFIKQNNEVVAQTIANWFLFDVEKNKIAKIPESMKNKYEFYEFKDDFFNYKKPDILENITQKYSVAVSNKDIDTNMHLNNQKSAEILMDALPYDFDFKEAKIMYKKPAFLGDVLYVCFKEINCGFYVELQNNKNETCVVGEFKIL